MTMTTIEMDADYCEQCQRVVPEGTEHSWEAHGGSREDALELMQWKESFKQ